MERFVLDFRIAKNITAPVGEKTVYVRIMKPDDDVLVKSRADVFAFEGTSTTDEETPDMTGRNICQLHGWDIENSFLRNLSADILPTATRSERETSRWKINDGDRRSFDKAFGRIFRNLWPVTKFL